MVKRIFIIVGIALIGAAALKARPSWAQSHPDFVTIERRAGALYRPDSGPAPHIGFIYVNGGSNALFSPLCSGLAARGFLVLCTTSRAESNVGLAWENVALDVKQNIAFLRAQPGITKVILYGHSGGGAVASFYQAVAENGVAFCQDPKKLSKCGDALAGLPPADGVVFPDAHPGLGVMDLRGINPSLNIDARDPSKIHIDPSLDLFDPANGFNANGPSHYSVEFQKRYEAAQAQRMNDLIAQAESMQARARQNGKEASPAADFLIIPGEGMPFAHLDEYDPDVFGTTATVKPRKLLKNDGTIVTQMIKSVSVGNPQAVMPGAISVVAERTAKFLSQGSVRAKDSIADIDYCTSNSVTICNAGSIRAPVLFIPMGANNFITDEERMYERSPAKDKDYIVVEGGLHGGEPCVKCETTPGQYANSQNNMFDYIRDWANKRF